MPTQTHPVEPEELMAYLDGELPRGDAALAAAHLEGCGDCQALAAEFANLTAHLQEWQVEAPVFACPEKPVADRRRLKPAMFWTAGVAACLVLAFVAAQFRPRGVPISAWSPSASRAVRMMNEPLNYIGRAPAPRAKFSRTEGPLIARSASLIMVVNNLDQARAAIDRIVQTHAGYVAHMDVIVPNDSARHLDATVNTPAAELDATIRELRPLGEVGSESRSGEEVTQQSVDLDARLANARNTEKRLTELLRERTGKLSDVLAVENQIDSTREEIERMEAERKNLDTRIAFATIDLHVSEFYKAALEGTRAPVLTRLRNAGIEGLQRVADSFIAAFTWLLSAGPVLLVWLAVLFFPARWAWRRFRR
jgi:predicted anti-sigma-YlaC factor YlaD